MGALPKNKVSRHRRGNRRRHQVLQVPTLVTCPKCNSLMRAHRVCKECGTYRGRQVIRQEQEADS
jgi:large subunit ribosomal protein L32